MNEKQLIHSAGKGDKEAFAKLYGLYKDRLYRYAYYRLGNSCDAKMRFVILYLWLLKKSVICERLQLFLHGYSECIIPPVQNML